jgi:hypothetical protein
VLDSFVSWDGFLALCSIKQRYSDETDAPIGDNAHVMRISLRLLLPWRFDRKTREKFPVNDGYEPYSETALVSTPPKKEVE